MREHLANIDEQNRKSSRLKSAGTEAQMKASGDLFRQPYSNLDLQYNIDFLEGFCAEWKLLYPHVVSLAEADISSTEKPAQTIVNIKESQGIQVGPGNTQVSEQSAATINAGKGDVPTKTARRVYPTRLECPDVSSLTSGVPGLTKVIEQRWRESQICHDNGCYVAGVILMGSILEALLLARVTRDEQVAKGATNAPSGKVTSWSLNSLIDVAVSVGWLKEDRARFGHALRQSRNVVHPWRHVAEKASFDDSTCRTCWEVLNGAVGDLLSSL